MNEALAPRTKTSPELYDIYGPEPIAVAHLNAQKQAGQAFFEEGKRIDYVPPSAINGHYPHNWLWDGAFASKVYTRYSYLESATLQISAIFDTQHDDGFIPNMTFASRGRKFDIERRTFTEPDKCSNYSQPPILAEAVMEFFNACQTGSQKEADQEKAGKEYLRQVYPKLKKFYEYFLDNRQVSPNNLLIFNVHPCETGRDSDPTFDFIKHKKPLANKGHETPTYRVAINTVADYIGNVALGFRSKKHGWDPTQAHQTFKFCDVMFNCLFAKNLRDLALIAEELGEVDEAISFHNKADRLSEQIQTRMYRSNQKESSKNGFFGIDYTGRWPELLNYMEAGETDSDNVSYFRSVSNLFPLVLDDLDLDKLRQTLDLIDDEFTDNFMIPTVSTKSPDYDANYRQSNMWRGPVWLWINDFLTSAVNDQLKRLDMQETSELTTRLETLQKKLVDSGDQLLSNCNNPLDSKNFAVRAINKFIPFALRSQSIDDGPFQNFAEFFSPKTGYGFRTRPFAGSSIACRQRQY